jgi:hypothetical protein
MVLCNHRSLHLFSPRFFFHSLIQPCNDLPEKIASICDSVGIETDTRPQRKTYSPEEKKMFDHRCFVLIVDIRTCSARQNDGLWKRINLVPGLVNGKLLFD